MSSLSILARGERLRERLLTDVATDLRITGFQSPAEDEKEDGLSLDRLTGLGSPHIWGVQVLDDSLIGFGIFRGDRLIVNRAASHLDDKLVVVDLGGEGYRVRLVQRDLFGGRWLKAADPTMPDLQLDGEQIIEVWGVVGSKSCVAMSIPSRVFALIDCNSFYCSCERICQPELKRRPVVVLSNNDGCIIARSSEAKLLGIGMGAAYYKVRHELRRQGVVARSSNYPLYADISNRVMHLMAEMLPSIEVYSIDEAWGDMTGVVDPEGLGRSIRERLAREIGMPVGVGISTTKTLAKLANWAAKKWKGTGGVLDLTDPIRQDKLLRLAPVSEVWGVGHLSASKLAALNISTAWDLAQFEIGTLRKTFGVTMERTARELRGISCIGFNEGPPPIEAISSSRMFGVRQTELPPIREALATYVSRAAEKLRAQGSLCSTIQVGLQTQLADVDGPRYANAVTLALPAPTDDTREILALAQRGLRQIYRPGYPFSKCSILLMDLSQRGELTLDLFAPKPRRGAEQLMAVVDQINQREGRGTVRIGRVPAKPAWTMRREMLSQRYTTRWDEVIGVRG